MTSARQAEASDHGHRLDLSVTQVLAGALAAVSSAVAASFFGVTGTIVGAAFGSITATVAAAIYKQSLAKTNEKLRTIVPIQTVVLRPLSDVTKRMRGDDEVETVRFAGGTEAPGHPAATTGSVPTPTDLPGEGAGAGPAAGEAAAAVDAGPAGPVGSADTGRGRRWWLRIAVAAAVAFIVALGAVWTAEKVFGRPLSSLVTGKPGSGTTFDHVVTPGYSPTPTTTPSVTETPTPTPTDTPSATPSSPSESPPESATPSDQPSGSPAPSGSGDASSAPTPRALPLSAPPSG